MAQVNDLSRSLTAFDPISTLVVVVEMSKVEFIDENGGGPGVRFRKRQRAKQSK